MNLEKFCPLQKAALGGICLGMSGSKDASRVVCPVGT